MLAKLTKLVVVCALVFSAGAHWTILQSVAWVGMTVSFAQTAPLSEALAKTFDGKHPCHLCRLVQDGKKSEKRQDAQTESVKLDLCLDAQPITLSAPALEHLSRLREPLPGLLTQAPPFPPPRLLPG